MQLELGAQLPAWQWDLELSELKDWAQGAEALGYEWLGITDHVFYAYDTDNRPPARYSGGTIQHEALTFLAWLSALTETAQLTTSVLVLPQRQASLVAKQAAEIDILSSGRLRLGVGVGWQEAEYDGLGKSFNNRGRRAEEDIALIRECWTAEPLDLDTSSEHLDQLSMMPKPFTPGGPPILYGGGSKAGIDRAARLCDGYIAQTRFTAEEAAQLVADLDERLAANGRDRSDFPIQATVAATDDLDELAATFRMFLDAGFTRLGLHLPGIHDLGEDPAKISVDQHLAQLERIRTEVWLAVTG